MASGRGPRNEKASSEKDKASPRGKKASSKKSMASSPSWWERNKDRVSVGLLLAGLLGWATYITHETVIGLPSRVQKVEEAIGELQRSDSELRKEIVALKCYLYDEKYVEFLKECTSSTAPEWLPEVACMVDGKVIAFKDPLPQVEGECR